MAKSSQAKARAAEFERLLGEKNKLVDEMSAQQRTAQNLRSALNSALAENAEQSKSLDQVRRDLATEQWQRAALQVEFDALNRNFIRLEAVVLSRADLVMPPLEPLKDWKSAA